VYSISTEHTYANNDGARPIALDGRPARRRAKTTTPPRDRGACGRHLVDVPYSFIMHGCALALSCCFCYLPTYAAAMHGLPTPCTARGCQTHSRCHRLHRPGRSGCTCLGEWLSVNRQCGTPATRAGSRPNTGQRGTQEEHRLTPRCSLDEKGEINTLQNWRSSRGPG